MKLSAIVNLTVLCAAVATAQFSKQQMDSVRAATEQDYHFMLAQLHIDSLRPGPSGNPKAPNAANVDESKATRYSSLPDPLVFNDGGTVTGADVWWKKRRPELLNCSTAKCTAASPNISQRLSGVS